MLSTPTTNGNIFNGLSLILMGVLAIIGIILILCGIVSGAVLMIHKKKYYAQRKSIFYNTLYKHT